MTSCVAIAALLFGAGCGTDGPTTVQPAADGPTSLQPAAEQSPAGSKRVTCGLAVEERKVRFALDLPKGFSKTRAEEADCAWHRSVTIPDEDYVEGDGGFDESYDIDVVVTVRAVGDDESLQEVYDEEEPFLVDGDSPQGDDSVLELNLDEDVETFGDTVGDRLSWLCFCDGQNTLTRLAQADGVRMTWSSASPLDKETDKQVNQALAGAGTVG